MKRNYGRKNRTKGMQIIENVCAHFNTTLDDLCGSNKMPSLNIYRQIAFYLLHEEADYTSKDAVAAFGMTSSSEAGRGNNCSIFQGIRLLPGVMGRKGSGIGVFYLP
jgi:hypothetical protein